MKPHTIRYERRRFKRYDMVTRDCRLTLIRVRGGRRERETCILIDLSLDGLPDGKGADVSLRRRFGRSGNRHQRPHRLADETSISRHLDFELDVSFSRNVNDAAIGEEPLVQVHAQMPGPVRNPRDLLISVRRGVAERDRGQRQKRTSKLVVWGLVPRNSSR